MKKIVIGALAFVCISVCGFAKELEGVNLQAVNMALDAKLYVGRYEELQDQLDYLESVEKQIGSFGDSISDEAKLICKGTLLLQKETSKAEYKAQLEKNQKKKGKKEKDTELEARIMNLFEEYKSFMESHSDLSAHFYLHYREAELSTLEYISMSKQIEIYKNIVSSYKSIEAINPDYGENLFTYAMMLYNAPKMAGGDKALAHEKALKAIEVSKTDYEKATANIIYSQILVEDKKIDEAKKYFLEGKKMVPENKKYDEIQKMNEAGYSMFQSEEYEKKKN